jgi:hypothetical protein
MRSPNQMELCAGGGPIAVPSSGPFALPEYVKMTPGPV